MSATPAVQRRVLLVVFLTVFLDLIGFGIVIPLLPLYVTAMHASALVVGFILTSFALTQLLATPLLGRLSDRYGRRRIILLSLGGNAVSMIIFAMATHLGWLWLLFVSRILAGATAGNISACQAAIADVMDDEGRAAAMGKIGAGIGLGLVVGPLVAAQFSRLGPSAPPLGAAALALLDLVLACALMPETRAARPEGKEAGKAPSPPLLDVLRERRMAGVLGLSFLTFMGMSTFQATLALLTRERFGWGAHEVGNIFGMFGLIMLIVQGGLLGRLARAVGEIGLTISGAALNVVGMAMIAAAHRPPLLLVGLGLSGLGVALINPSLSSLSSRLAPRDMQGAVLGFTQSAGGLARTVGPTWSGLLYAHLSPGAPFLGGAVTAFLSLLIGLGLRSTMAERAQKPEAR